LRQVKNALQLFLRSLPEGTFFNSTIEQLRARQFM